MPIDFKLIEIASKPLWDLGRFLIGKHEELKFHRDVKSFGDYNRFYGPMLFEEPKHCYAYLTLRIINEGPKILLRDIKASIFNIGNQQDMVCEIIETPPTEKQGLGQIYTSLRQFPNGFDQIGLPNKMEIPAESCRDYFFALRCLGFKTNNVEEKELESFKDEFSMYVNFDLTLDFFTSRNRRFPFKTLIWSVDPSKHDQKKEIII